MAEKEKRCGDGLGDAGVCRLKDRYLLPVHSCEDFTPKKEFRSGALPRTA